MSIRATVKIEGLRDLDAALADLGTRTGKNVLRRTGLKVLQPIADAARAIVSGQSVDSGRLEESIAVSTRLSRRQARAARRDGKSSVQVYVGAGPLRQAHLVEFGTGERFHASGKSVGSMSPEPFMRPAWDQGQGRVLEDTKRELWSEIDKAAQRAARKAARLAARQR